MARSSRDALVLTLLAVLSGTSGCVRAGHMLSPAVDLASVAAPRDALTRHVVLVSIDGLRPDAIARFAAPTLQRLVREGAHSLTARTILPSKTLPSHASMLSGEPPDQHGVLWNTVASAKTDVVEFSTVFSVARAHGYRTAAFFSKAKFTPLQRPGTLDYSQAPGGWFGRWSSERTVGDVLAHLTHNPPPNLLFVHLPDPDEAGHEFGWMGGTYARAVERTDAAVARLLLAADKAYGPGRYSVIVTADHGGHDYDHGSSDVRDVTIPWIAWGLGVRPGGLDDVRIETFDTASTVLWLLGAREPDAWDGAPVVSAFREQAPVRTY